MIRFFVFSTPMAGAGMVLACVALPLLIALIAVSVMKGNMKSVAIKRQAAKYMTGGGLKLAQRQDVYINTTTETRMKSKPAGK